MIEPINAERFQKDRPGRPTIVHDKQMVNDPHDNPALAIDGRGHVWIFSNAHGTSRPAWIHRSVRPFSIDAFEEILKGKLFAAFRRNLGLLIPLLVLYVLVVVLGPTHQSGPLLLALSIGAGLVGSVVFLLGAGVYLSTRLKTTAGAVASTLAVFIVPKLFCCGVPGPLFLLSPGSSGGPFAGMFAVALVPPAVHVVAGLLCMRAALRRLRRNVF